MGVVIGVRSIRIYTMKSGIGGPTDDTPAGTISGRGVASGWCARLKAGADR
jgi:hypothetical protein